jgi:hypothetical protein
MGDSRLKQATSTFIAEVEDAMAEKKKTETHST